MGIIQRPVNTKGQNNVELTRYLHVVTAAWLNSFELTGLSGENARHVNMSDGRDTALNKNAPFSLRAVTAAWLNGPRKRLVITLGLKNNKSSMVGNVCKPHRLVTRARHYPT